NFSTKHFSPSDCVDVIGTVVSISDLIPFRGGLGQEKRRRTILLQDVNGLQLECCFFDGWADRFNILAEHRDKVGHVVLILQLARVKYFNDLVGKHVDHMEKTASSNVLRSCSDEIFGGATHGSQHGVINRGGNSFASVLQAKSNKKVVKIQELRNENVVEGAAVAIPFEAVEEVKSRFSNTLYGFFIGKRLAFPLVENYVKNTWAKYGLKRIQLHDDFFLFQFENKDGMDKVLEDGPWLIRTVPLIMNVWSPNTDLKKAEVMKAPVWIMNSLQCFKFLLLKIIRFEYMLDQSTI
ncbi:zinc knuckle CX2CX4HX4C containing protein, partial [Tanacetum coccineum]